VSASRRAHASLARNPDGSWSARVKSPPDRGQANRELIALLAERFRCPQTAVSIRSGLASGRKWVRITAATTDEGAEA